MNELLNTVNLQALGVESPPGVSLKEGQSTGADGFAAMLSQLGQAIPALVFPGLTEDGTQQNEVSPAAQVALLQLLGSVGLTGQQQAMDGTSTGSLPINAQQGFDLMSLNLGVSPVETLATARQLLATAIPVSIAPQPIVVSEQQPSAGIASLNGAECQVPADLMLSNGDLAKLQAILSQVSSPPPQSVAIQPDLSLMTPVKSVIPLPEVRSQLGGMEQLLKEQFPTLNIENLSAQLNLKSPELVKTDTAPVALTKILPSDGLPAKPSIGQSVDAILPQTTSQNRPPINILTEVIPSTGCPDLSASQTVAALSSPVTQLAPTVAVAQTTLPTDTTPHSDLTTTPEIIKTAQEGSLEKTAVKGVENTSDYLQTAQHWNKLTSDHSDPPVVEQVAETRDPQIDKTKLKIQFDRFQIDALLQRSEIKIQLHPASLGSMRVKLVSTSQEVTARFETTSEAARTAVEQNLPQLRESLDKAGIKVDHVEVVLDEQRARQQQSHYQNQKRQTSDTDITDDIAQQVPFKGGGVINTAVQSMLGSLNLLA
jgi:hypothetical protein